MTVSKFLTQGLGNQKWSTFSLFSQYSFSFWAGRWGTVHLVSRKWQPTPIFLPGKSHGQRNLVKYSPSGFKELNTTEVTDHGHLMGSLFPKLG